VRAITRYCRLKGQRSPEIFRNSGPSGELDALITRIFFDSFTHGDRVPCCRGYCGDRCRSNEPACKLACGASGKNFCGENKIFGLLTKASSTHLVKGRPSECCWSPTQRLMADYSMWKIPVGNRRTTLNGRRTTACGRWSLGRGNSLGVFSKPPGQSAPRMEGYLVLPVR